MVSDDFLDKFDYDGKFNGFDPENSLIIMLSSMTIGAMIWKYLIVCEPRNIWIQ